MSDIIEFKDELFTIRFSETNAVPVEYSYIGGPWIKLNGVIAKYYDKYLIIREGKGEREYEWSQSNLRRQLVKTENDKYIKKTIDEENRKKQAEFDEKEKIRIAEDKKRMEDNQDKRIIEDENRKKKEAEDKKSVTSSYPDPRLPLVIDDIKYEILGTGHADATYVGKVPDAKNKIRKDISGAFSRTDTELFYQLDQLSPKILVKDTPFHKNMVMEFAKDTTGMIGDHLQEGYKGKLIKQIVDDERLIGVGNGQSTKLITIGRQSSFITKYSGIILGAILTACYGVWEYKKRLDKYEYQLELERIRNSNDASGIYEIKKTNGGIGGSAEITGNLGITTTSTNKIGTFGNKNPVGRSYNSSYGNYGSGSSRNIGIDKSGGDFFKAENPFPKLTSAKSLLFGTENERMKSIEASGKVKESENKLSEAVVKANSDFQMNYNKLQAESLDKLNKLSIEAKTNMDSEKSEEKKLILKNELKLKIEEEANATALKKEQMIQDTLKKTAQIAYDTSRQKIQKEYLKDLPLLFRTRNKEGDLVAMDFGEKYDAMQKIMGVDPQIKREIDELKDTIEKKKIRDEEYEKKFMVDGEENYKLAVNELEKASGELNNISANIKLLNDLITSDINKFSEEFNKLVKKIGINPNYESTINVLIKNKNFSGLKDAFPKIIDQMNEFEKKSSTDIEKLRKDFIGSISDFNKQLGVSLSTLTENDKKVADIEEKLPEIIKDRIDKNDEKKVATVEIAVRKYKMMKNQLKQDESVERRKKEEEEEDKNIKSYEEKIKLAIDNYKKASSTENEIINYGSESVRDLVPYTEANIEFDVKRYSELKDIIVVFYTYLHNFKSYKKSDVNKQIGELNELVTDKLTAIIEFDEYYKDINEVEIGKLIEEIDKYLKFGEKYNLAEVEKITITNLINSIEKNNNELVVVGDKLKTAINNEGDKRKLVNEFKSRMGVELTEIEKQKHETALLQKEAIEKMKKIQPEVKKQESTIKPQTEVKKPVEINPVQEIKKPVEINPVQEIKKPVEINPVQEIKKPVEEEEYESEEVVEKKIKELQKK